MKSYTKRIRALRRLAIAGCLAALAIPAGASAMQPNEIGVRAENAQQSQQQPYTLPSEFRTEVQTAAQSPASFALRRDFRPEVQTQAPSHASIPAASVVRQIETVNDGGGRTLSLVLASIALAVALGSLGYAATRMTQIQRREAGSH
jgi:uncharacterized protein HemX